MWLTSHPRSTVVLLDTGTPGTSREIYSESTSSSILEKYKNLLKSPENVLKFKFQKWVVTLKQNSVVIGWGVAKQNMSRECFE